MPFSTDRSQPVRVLISDMSPLIASGVHAALDASLSFEVAKGRFEDLVDGRMDDLPGVDVVVADGTSGLQLAKARQTSSARSAVRAARIFLLSQNNGERDIRQALEAGIHGYATLNLSLEEFQNGIRTVANGLRYVCPSSAQRLADSMTREPLTPREAQVLTQLSQGDCNKTIAHELEMALGTVKAHVKSLMSKLDAKTRTQVVSVAIARGLVDPGVASERGPKVRSRFDERRVSSGDLAVALV